MQRVRLEHDFMSEHQFTPEEVAAVRAAIRAAGETMREWDEATRVSPEKMRKPMRPPPQRYPSHDLNFTGPPKPPLRPFSDVLREAINGQSMENGSNTPDFILADFLHSVLNNLDAAIAQRDKWYGVKLEPCARLCREYDWENGERVRINVGAIFKIGKRLWRLVELPRQEQGIDGWKFEYTEKSDGSCDQYRTFTRSEVQWLYSHGAFVGHPVEADGAEL
jgi:hypothetical protein